MFKKKDRREWRNGVYLCTARDSFEADLLNQAKKRGNSFHKEV